ncbi:ATP-dependent DNA helicase UvrD/PcrA/Rep, epsilon proteobacterial type 1 [hydrothermal vent metagenome]|uniref:DNA 3'-5' helicase n=1 Tax=hydrothermal vent metagenome TaxID=652676 RepID=A0A1W1EHH3_9ZZZZ
MPLSNLNQEQLSAVKTTSGANLVIASAGTGKTSTIVGRIAYLLNSGVEPSKIVLLTFTNKASGEMIARLENFFPPSLIAKIESGTFHAISYRWLKSAYPNLVLKQPNELKTLFRSIYEKRAFKRMSNSIEPFSSQHLYEQYSLYQNISLDGFDKWFIEKYPEHEPLMDIYMDIVDNYEREKDEYGFLSFNDLLIKTREFIKVTPQDIDEVLVDEYQDTNRLQSALIDDLNSKSLFCVGDYDQSIYAFNGADIENISTFSRRYKNAKVHTLKTNYRSSASILSLANRVIEYNERIYPKSLEVGRVGESIKPKLLIYNELFEQYQSIASMIKSSPQKYQDIAVIFRNNSSADGIEASLREVGIPSKRKGGNSFFEAKEIKILLDLLALIVNPKDMMAFIHIFEYARNVGSALAKEFFTSLIHFGDGELFRGLNNPVIFDLPKLNPNKNLQLGLFDDDEEIGSLSRFSTLNISSHIKKHPLLKHPKITDDGVRFFDYYYEFMQGVTTHSHTSTIIRRAISSKLYQFVVELLATSRGRLKNGEIDEKLKAQAKERIERKAKLLLDLSANYKEVSRFINAMILGGNELSEGEGVNLLTVHASKGLEFNSVFVVDLMEGRFPNHKLSSKSGSGVEEERRLFYVAVTRARDELSLSLARYDKMKKLDFKPSQFLYEAKMLREGSF